jgi:hypothetical protein
LFVTLYGPVNGCQLQTHALIFPLAHKGNLRIVRGRKTEFLSPHLFTARLINLFKSWIHKIEIPVRMNMQNTVSVQLAGIPGSYLTVEIEYETGSMGPIFTGPKQYPFLCRTEEAGLSPAFVLKAGIPKPPQYSFSLRD